jgi:hypothetical protein
MVSRFACGKSTASKFDAGLHQVRNEGDVTGEAVQLGDDELGSMHAARGQRLRQFWSVLALAAFDFNKFADDPPIATVEVVADGFLLSLKAEAGAALALSADPIAGDEAAGIHRNDTPVKPCVMPDHYRNSLCAAGRPTLARNVPALKSLFPPRAPGPGPSPPPFLARVGTNTHGLPLRSARSRRGEPPRTDDTKAISTPTQIVFASRSPSIGRHE